MIRTLCLASGALLAASCSVPSADTSESANMAGAPDEVKIVPASMQTGPEPTPTVDDTPQVPPAPAEPANCDAGLAKQGGLLLCENGEPGTVIRMNGEPVAKFDASGRAAIGLAQAAPLKVTLSIPQPDGDTVSKTVTLAEREDFYAELSMKCNQIDARTDAEKAHAARAWKWKQAAFAEFHDGSGFHPGVTRPAEGVTSSPFGPTRKYSGVDETTGEVCEKTSVHRGYDIATPVGTPLIAPADGIITLADELYYEGNAIFLDHGQGLVSIFMHLSEMDVAEGDVIKRGDVIGKTGNTGRTTGPHLHWSVKWRNTASDDRNDDFYIDPALILEAG